MKLFLVPFLLVPVLFITGCSKEYVSNMQARKDIAWVQTTNQRMAVKDIMNVAYKILNPLEEQAISKYREVTLPTLMPSGAKVPSGDNYAMFLFADTMGKMIEQQGKAEIMRARADAIRYMIPIIESIYNQNLADFGTPMGSNEVYAKLVDNIPFMATVAGMVSLGNTGIKNAGGSVYTTVAEEGGVVGAGNITSGSVSTEAPVTTTTTNPVTP